MPNEIITATPSHEPGDLLQAYGAEPASPEVDPSTDPGSEAPASEAVPEVAPQETPEEPTLPPDVEEMKKNLLKDYHQNRMKDAERLRAVQAREQALGQRETALQQKIQTYEVYDEFDRVLEADPELRAAVEARVPGARGKVGRPQTDDRVIAEMAETRRMLAETHIEMVEAQMSTRPDWHEAHPKMLDLFAETGMLANAQNPRQLKQLYEVAYAAVTAGKKGAVAEADAQRKLVGQVKKAQQAARLGGGNAPAPTAPGPSSFDSTGRLRTWTEIAADARASLQR